MSTPPLSASFSKPDAFNLEQAFKQFSLETERLERTYQSLQERFKAAQTTLQESQTRLSGKLAELDFTSRYLESILHHISQGILFIDLQGIVTTYNAAAQQLLHIPEKELLFRPFTDFFSDTFLGFSLKATFASKQCPRMMFISIAHEGQESEIEVEATFVSMSQQAYPLAHRQADSPPIQGLLILLRNITKVRRLQQMANQHDHLRELGELMSHLAHEIRNPLGGIKGYASLLAQDLADRPASQDMAKAIIQGVDGLDQFVTQVMARPFQPQIEMVDLIPFIDEIRQLMQADAAWNARIHFQVKTPVQSLLVPIDPHYFQSALLNLFVNATQAMPEGGDLIIEIEPHSSWVTLRVRDTGTGIAPEHLTRIFSPFFTTKQTGHGLGLAEVKKVIQAHHGWIEVQSEVGKGTTFIMKIPLKLGE